MGGMSPLRAAYFARHLVQRGHIVDVLTIRPSDRNPTYPLDHQSVSVLPASVKVHRTYAGPLHHLKGVATPQMHQPIGAKETSLASLIPMRQWLYRLGQVVAFPDSASDWIPWALWKGINLVRRTHYNVLFAFTPPLPAYIVGYCLNRVSGIPWVVHLGDPWSFNPAHEHYPLWRKALNRWVEQRLLHTVSQVIVHTQETANGYLKIFPFLQQDKLVVTGKGVDLEEYRLTSPEPLHTSQFRIVYTGIFYPSIQQPLVFFDALGEFVKTHPNVHVVIVGNVQQQYFDYVQQRGLQTIVEFLGHQPHHRVVALQKGATILLAFGAAKGYQLPSKLIEYFAAQRPILVISPDTSDIAGRVVGQQKRGIATLANPRQVYDALEFLYCLWQTGALEHHFNLMEPVDYSWERIVDTVEEALLTAASPSIHTRAPGAYMP